MRRKFTSILTILVFQFSLFLNVACIDESDPCGIGMNLVNGGCLADKEDDEDDAGSNVDSGLPSGMGEPCIDHSKCTDQADFCTSNPFTDKGYCSIKDCTLEPNDCPEGYRCFDPSVFIPDQPTVCITEEEYEQYNGSS
ncbi:MAG: hypothetical protein GY847_17290 [Proteobacteria bacterium]|nr:hypothetical protein [Pseudomonadota bacterium]